MTADDLSGAGGQEERYACEFADLFAVDGVPMTPSSLIEAGLYDPIAITLKGSHWRPMSLAMLAKAVAADLPPIVPLTGSNGRPAAWPRTGSNGRPAAWPLLGRCRC